MLRQLTIKNIGVIDRLDIPFEAGFTVLTGETGAGKSIIVDCISLALGAKADALLLRSGAETARVEAVFELDADDILLPPELLRKIGIKDSKPGLSLRMTREISKDGRTECTVNGRKVALKVLQETGRHLAEAHGQRQTLVASAPRRTARYPRSLRRSGRGSGARCRNCQAATTNSIRIGQAKAQGRRAGRPSRRA